METSVNNIIKKKFLGNCLVKGWVKTKRDSKIGLSFIQINDGSCLDNLQVIAKASLNNYEEIKKITPGCSIIAQGCTIKSIGKNQSIELQAKNIVIVDAIKNKSKYPIQPKYHTLEYLRSIPHLRNKTNIFGSINRIRSKTSYLFHKFFHDNSFFLINTPIITSNDCEGGGSLFSLNTKEKSNFFNKEAFLTVSGQLHLEAFALSMTKVYTFGPTFRAENSNTARHLSEFWMLEAEIAFFNMSEIIKFIEKMLRYIIQNIIKECEDDLIFTRNYSAKKKTCKLEKLIDFDLMKLEYSEAIEILKKNNHNFLYPVKWGIDLQKEHEIYLTDIVFKKPLILLNFPQYIKSFYMKLNSDNKTVRSFDILFPGVGEVIGGSEREDNLEKINKRIVYDKIKSDIDWYLDLRRYGSAPHSGFGLGLERFISYITNIQNVRDVIPFPRSTGNIYH